MAEPLLEKALLQLSLRKKNTLHPEAGMVSATCWLASSAFKAAKAASQAALSSVRFDSGCDWISHVPTPWGWPMAI